MLDITASSDARISYFVIKYFASALVLISFLCKSLITAGSVCIAFHTCWFMLSIVFVKFVRYKNIPHLTHFCQIAGILRFLVIMYINDASIHFRIL